MVPIFCLMNTFRGNVHKLESCPILSHRVHWKIGHNDLFDLSNGEYLYSIGKVQLTIRLLHVISQTIAVVVGPHKLLSIRSIRSICQMENTYIRLEKNIAVVVGPHKLLSIRSIRLICQMKNTYIRLEKNIAVVVGPHKLLSIRSICQMENTYIRLEKFSLPFDYCMSLARLRKISLL